MDIEELKKRLRMMRNAAATGAADALSQLQAENAELRRELDYAEMAASAEAKFADEMKAERDAARRELEEAQKDAGAKQAEIDRLMLEYCPDEMTTDQMAEWAAHQRPAARQQQGDDAKG
jgi:chromosome segregation ATPase